MLLAYFPVHAVYRDIGEVMAMRSIRLGLALAACLAVAGCIGGNRTTVQSTSPSQAAPIAKIAPIPTPSSTATVAELLKSGADLSPPTPRSAATARPTVRPTTSPEAGPLSCLEQRMQALRDGKVLPSNQCS
jgi:hypothetical protein